VLVVDPSGAVFSLLRSLGLGVPLFRLASRTSLLDLSDVGLAVLAVDERRDWDGVAELSEVVPTLIVAAKANGEDASRALAMGAVGYIDACLPQEAFRRAILGAMHGEAAYSRQVLAEQIRAQGRSLHAAKSLPLTPRQREVVRLIATGAADKEIAQALGIATTTAQKHVTNLLRRLKVSNRAAAAAIVSAAR
jgi:DNA-binding NarL/FixJ family response regulator